MSNKYSHICWSLYKPKLCNQFLACSKAKEREKKEREEDDIQRFIPWPRDQDGEWPSILEDICAQRLLSLWLAVTKCCCLWYITRVMVVNWIINCLFVCLFFAHFVSYLFSFFLKFGTECSLIYTFHCNNKIISSLSLCSFLCFAKTCCFCFFTPSRFLVNFYMLIILYDSLIP